MEMKSSRAIVITKKDKMRNANIKSELGVHEIENDVQKSRLKCDADDKRNDT